MRNKKSRAKNHSHHLILFLIVSALAGATSVDAATTAIRPVPAAGYHVGDVAVVTICTQPALDGQPVYRWRQLNGLDDGPQPLHLDETGADGCVTREYQAQAKDVGRYTGEQFAVGSPTAPRTSAQSYDVHANAPPTAFRAAPYPIFRADGSAVLVVTTNPVQAHQPVHRFRYRDGQPDEWGSIVGWTGASGSLTNDFDLSVHEIGSYTEERYSVGTPEGPLSSPANDYVVRATAPPTVVRPLPFPEYHVGEIRVIDLSTVPPQAHQKVYRWRHRDSQPDGDQPLVVGWTDGNGSFTYSQELQPSDAGDYTGEQFAVGAEDPKSPAVSYTVAPGGPSIDSITPSAVPEGQVTSVVLVGRQLDGVSVTVTADDGATPPLASIVGGAADGTNLEVSLNATDPRVGGHFMLAISNGTTGATIPFVVAGPGPVVEAWTPDEPERGKIYSLMILGSGLEGARVHKNASLVSILHVEAQEQMITGILQIGEGAALGPLPLTIRAPDGGETTITLTVVYPGYALDTQKNQINVTENAAAQAAKVGEKVPEIYFQDLSRPQSRIPIYLDCSVEGHATYSSYYTVFAPFDPLTGELHQNGVIELAPGVPTLVGNRVLSAFVDLSASFHWDCWPPEPPKLCFFGTIGFEIAGLGGQVLRAGGCIRERFTSYLTTSGILGNYTWGDPPADGTVLNDCLEVVPQASPHGAEFASVTMHECCEDVLVASVTGVAFAETPWAEPYSAQNFALQRVVPIPDTCPSGRYDIIIRAFIHWDHVPASGETCVRGGLIRNLLFQGDDRFFTPYPTGFGGNLGYRTEQKVSIYPDLSRCPAGKCDENGEVLGSRSFRAGVTSYYEDLSTLADKLLTRDDYDGTADDCYLFDHQCQHSVDLNTPGWSLEVSRPFETFVNMRFRSSLDACSLLPQFLVPEIDWDFRIVIGEPGGGYSIHGLHDCFPAYEVFINNQRVWGYLPTGDRAIDAIPCLHPPLEVEDLCSGRVHRPESNCPDGSGWPFPRGPSPTYTDLPLIGPRMEKPEKSEPPDSLGQF